MATLRFWLNAFIPRDVPNYTQVIAKGRHMGKTAVPLPGMARIWPGNTFKDWNAGYLTDQRGFDARYGASSRMTSMVLIDLDTMKIVRQGHMSSGTTEVNMESGEETGFDYADMSKCKFKEIPPAVPPRQVATGSLRFPTVAYPGQATGVKIIKLSLEAAAGDPLVGMAADIDYVGELQVALRPDGVVVLDYMGLIDEFPAYDCYAYLGETTKTVFKSPPPAGNTVTDLLGSANRKVAGSVGFA